MFSMVNKPCKRLKCVESVCLSPLDTFYGKNGGPLGIWRRWAPHAHGHAMKGGYFFSEENPDETALIVKQFLPASATDYGGVIW
jgi:hypothetical protein